MCGEVAGVKLTEKQKKFIDYFIETGVQTEAARLAGYKRPKDQASQIYENLRNHIEERLREKDEARIAKQDEVLQTLTRILRREEAEQIVVTLKERRSFYDEAGKKVIEETETPTIVDVKPKLSDVNKAAELLGKRYGLYSEKVEVSGEVQVDDARARLLERLTQRPG